MICGLAGSIAPRKKLPNKKKTTKIANTASPHLYVSWSWGCQTSNCSCSSLKRASPSLALNLRAPPWAAHNAMRVHCHFWVNLWHQEGNDWGHWSWQRSFHFWCCLSTCYQFCFNSWQEEPQIPSVQPTLTYLCRSSLHSSLDWCLPSSPLLPSTSPPHPL